MAKEPNWLDGDGHHQFEWIARNAKEKAHARALVASGRAKIVHATAESYVKKGKGRRPPKLISYEAWSMELTSEHPDFFGA